MDRKAIASLVLAVLACAAHAGKSADECRQEVQDLPELRQQSAVVECLVSAASPSAPEQPRPALRKPSFGAPTPAQVARLRKVLPDHLLDPFSAVLADMYTVRFQGLKDLVICGTVNAKNGFGAFTGKRAFSFTADDVGQAFYLGGKDDFATTMIGVYCTR
jgi:hypothetical protein